MKKTSVIFTTLASLILLLKMTALGGETPLALHLYPQDQKIKAGESVTWYLTAAGSEPLQYQWKLDGKEIAGGRTNTLRILATKPSDQGLYTCSIKNQFGETTTEPVTLQVLSGNEFSTTSKIQPHQSPAHATASIAQPQP